MPSDREDSHRWNELKTLIDLHQSSLIRYASSLLRDTERAKDVVQDVFVKLYKILDSKAPRSPEAWLFRSVRNRSFDVMKKEGRMSLYESPEMAEGVASQDLESDRRTDDAISGLFELVDELPAKKREIVLLKFQQGLSYQEISDITGITTSNIGYLLHHAIKELKQQWEAVEAAER